MTAFQDVVIINEMNHILERYKNGELSNKDTLKLLMEKFSELQGGKPE